jgi:monoamine oxidase
VVTTSKGQYTTNKLLVSLTLGQLQAGQVTWNPPLPADKQSAINNIGFGSFEKLFVVFQTAFWTPGTRILHFIGRGTEPKYLEAWIVPNTLNLNALVFFISGNAVQEIGSWSKAQISQDLTNFLGSYTTNSVVVNDVFITNWRTDPFALGSYCYAKVGTTAHDFETLQAPITHGNNKIWLIG